MDVNCQLCLYGGKKKKTMYGCTVCGKGFHVNCFTAYHYAQELKGHQKALTNQLLKSMESIPRAKKKRSRHAGSIESIILPKQYL